MQRVFDNIHAAVVLDCAADPFAGTVTSKCVNAGKAKRVAFLIPRGNGATGTSKITLEACSDASGSNPTAIPYERIRQAPGANPVDTWGAYADVPAVGEDTPAGAYSLTSVEISNRALPDGKPFVRVKGVEQVDSPVPGCIIALMLEPRIVGPMESVLS